MNKITKILFLFLLFIFFSALSFTQETQQYKDIDNHGNAVPSRTAFEKIEGCISSGNVESLSGFFSSQIYLSLSNGISGYYSSNQAYYVLADFFKNYHVTAFKFNSINDDETSTYATGLYNFIFNEKRESAQVYVSIKLTGKEWKITQLTIN